MGTNTILSLSQVRNKVLNNQKYFHHIILLHLLSPTTPSNTIKDTDKMLNSFLVKSLFISNKGNSAKVGTYFTINYFVFQVNFQRMPQEFGLGRTNHDFDFCWFLSSQHLSLPSAHSMTLTSVQSRQCNSVRPGSGYFWPIAAAVRLTGNTNRKFKLILKFLVTASKFPSRHGNRQLFYTSKVWAETMLSKKG